MPLDRAALDRHRRRNQWQSLLVLAGIALLMAAAGWLVAGDDGVLWSVLAIALAAVLAPTDAPALMRALWGAVPLPAARVPELWRLAAALAERAQLDAVPPLYYIPSPQLMALSTGWGRGAAIAVSDGLLRTLPPRELAAVLAHEISHIRHGDLWVMRLADAAGRLTRLLSLFGLLLLAFYLPAAEAAGLDPALLPAVLLVAAPLINDLLMLKLSRTREFSADAGAVALTGDPQGLMAALERLDRIQRGGWETLRRPGWLRLVRTHPTTPERLARLAELAPARRPIGLPETLLPAFFGLGPVARRPWW